MADEKEDEAVCAVCGGQHDEQAERITERVAELQAKKRPTKADRDELAILTYDGPPPRVLPRSDEVPF